MDPLSDEKLIKSCLSGNQTHCRLLYERYNKLIVNIIWKRVRDSEVARDLTQETFLRAFKALKTYRGEANFKNWLVSIGVNQCKDYLKKPERGHERKIQSMDDPEDTKVKDMASSDITHNPEQKTLQDELKDVTKNSIEKLGMKHKETIMLWMEGFSYDEIAEITRVSTDTVGSRIHNAKMKLRKLLSPYFKEKKRKK